jgi:transposase-like protein
MSIHRRQYSRGFKVSAVRLLAESDKPVSEVALSLGIHESMLRKWRKQVQEGGEESFDESGRCPPTPLSSSPIWQFSIDYASTENDALPRKTQSGRL